MLSVILTAVIRNLSAQSGFVATPSADRHHRTIVPLGGGIAIFTTLTIVIAGAMGAVKIFAGGGYLNWLGESVTIHTAGF